MDKYLQEAIKEYERKIESGEAFYMDAPILMDIESYYEKLGRDYDAEHLMRLAEKLHPDNEEVLVVKASRLKSAGKWQKALDIVRAIPNQNNREVVLFLAEWDIAEGRPNEALRRVAKQMPKQMEPEDYDWLLDLSEIYLDYGYMLRARDLLLKIPKKYSFRPRVDELLAESYYQLQEYDKSIEAAEALINASPYDAVSWAQLADIQQKCGHLADCISSCDYALAIDDSNAQAMSLKVYATFGLGQVEEGLKLYEEFRLKLPENYAIRMYAGEQLYSAQRYAEALTPMEEALRLCPIENPDRSRIVNGLAYVQAELGRITDAEELMETLCLTGTSLEEIYLQLANIFFESRHRAHAIQALALIVHQENVDDNDLQRAIQMLYQHNTFKEAEKLWEEIAEMTFPENLTSLYVYAAVAMGVLRKQYLYRVSVTNAAEEAPATFLEVFGPRYKSKNLKEVLVKALEESDSMQ